jgi:hypothetical protein
MKITDAELRKKGAISGLLLGVILMVLSIVSYYFITSMASSIWMISIGPIIFSVILPIVVAAAFCSDLRKKSGGFWTFKQAVTGIFMMFLLGYVVNYIGYNLLFTKVIEPHAVEKTQTAVINATTSMMEKQGVDQDKIDQQTAKMQKQFEVQTDMSPVKVITSIAISLIFMFVLALIFAAIYKKDPPLFEPTAQDPAV